MSEALAVATPGSDVTLTVTIPGAPATGGVRHLKATGFTYTPKNVAEWRAFVRMLVLEECREFIPRGYPVELTILVTKPQPSSYPKKPTAKVPCPWAWTTKPDLDNVAKQITDAVKSVAMDDDNQITDMILRKRWGEREEVQITVRRVSAEQCL